MEVDREFLLLRISQFEKKSQEFNLQGLLNQGAAEGLKTVLKELEELEKQKPIEIDKLLRGAEIVKTNNDKSN